MTPLQAIIKNIIMIVVAIPIYIFWQGWKIKYNKLFSAFFGLTTVLVPFILNPVDYAYSSNNLEEKINYPLDLNLIYHPEDTSKIETPKKELRSGKHVLAFLSGLVSIVASPTVPSTQAPVTHSITTPPLGGIRL